MFKDEMSSVPFGNTPGKMPAGYFNAVWTAVKKELTPDEKRVILDRVYTTPFRERHGQHIEEGKKLIETALQLSLKPGVPMWYVYKMATIGMAVFMGDICLCEAMEIIGHTEDDD